MKKIPFFSNKTESPYHKAIKLMIYEFISENNQNILICSLEKKFGNRRADVYFKFKNVDEVVVEIHTQKY